MNTMATVLTLFLTPIIYAQTPEVQTNGNKRFKIGSEAALYNLKIFFQGLGPSFD
jgi:hypothetical protein